MITIRKPAGRQRGVTLLEVLVGFVIFSTSMVAVLDYVSGQIYQYQLSTSNLKELQLIYDASVADKLSETGFYSADSNAVDYKLMVSETIMDTYRQRGDDLKMKLSQYSTNRRAGGFHWSVIKVN